MTNISKEKRNHLLKNIDDIENFIKNAAPDLNRDNLLSLLYDLKKEINGKKYGLIFEEHCEHFDEMLENNLPVLTEKKDLFVNNGGGLNYLIEGDNLATLSILEKTHRGKIDVIYIDPPYNTRKNDFKYDDDYVDPNDDFTHSKWLSSLSKRLKMAKILLSPSGYISISIDAKEQGCLRCLCDEIFGEDNFIECLPRRTKASGKTTATISSNHDYILLYCKDKEYVEITKLEHIDDEFKLEDEYVSERGLYKLNQTLDYDSLQYSKSLDYPITIDGEIFYPGSSKERYLERQNGNHKRADWAWRWSPEKFKFGLDNGWIVVSRKKDGSARIYTKTYLNATIEKDKKIGYYIATKKRTKPLSTLEFIDAKYSNDNAKKDLVNIVGESSFDYSKPVELIKKLICLCSNKDALILDFYAGTGTSGQAVLELNTLDNGNRRFILATNNENNICRDITYKRVKKSIEGYRYKKSEKVVLYEKDVTCSLLKNSGKFLKEIAQVSNDNKMNYNSIKKSIKDDVLTVTGILEREELRIGCPASLKYYKVDYLPINEKFYYEYADELLKHTKELVELENGINFQDNSTIAIVLTDDELESFIKNISKFKNCKKLYIGHDVLTTGEQEQLFRLKNITIVIIPDYYYHNLEA